MKAVSVKVNIDIVLYLASVKKNFINVLTPTSIKVLSTAMLDIAPTIKK